MSEGWTEIFHLCPTGSPMVTDTTLIENIFLYKPLSKRAEFYVPTKPQFDEVIIPSNMLTGFFWLVVHHRLYSTTLTLNHHILRCSNEFKCRKVNQFPGYRVQVQCQERQRRYRRHTVWQSLQYCPPLHLPSAFRTPDASATASTRASLGFIPMWMWTIMLESSESILNFFHLTRMILVCMWCSYKCGQSASRWN